MRLAAIAGGIIFIGACAGRTPPGQPTPRNAMPIAASLSKAWDAVIDVFAERNIPIRTMERVSGFISTDQLSISDKQGLEWADCGKILSMPLGADHATYNVLVRGDSNSSTAKVTVRWTEETSSGRYVHLTECTTKGVWELETERLIKARAEGQPVTSIANATAVPKDSALVAFPPGTRWIADAGKKIYYPVECVRAKQVRAEDRYYYAGDEEEVVAAGYKRSTDC